jgi:hypothetical protein
MKRLTAAEVQKGDKIRCTRYTTPFTILVDDVTVRFQKNGKMVYRFHGECSTGGRTVEEYKADTKMTKEQ